MGIVYVFFCLRVCCGRVVGIGQFVRRGVDYLVWWCYGISNSCLDLCLIVCFKRLNSELGMYFWIDCNVSELLVQQIVVGVSGWICGNCVCVGMWILLICQLVRENQFSQFSVIEVYDCLVVLGMLELWYGLGFFVVEVFVVIIDFDSEWYEGVENVWGQFSGSLMKFKFGCGWILDSWWEVEEFSYVICQVVCSEFVGLFDYSILLGLLVLCQYIQKCLWLIDIYVDLEQIFIIIGVSYVFDLLVCMLFKLGDVVVVENFGYYNLFNLLKFYGVKMFGVLCICYGLDIVVLEMIFCVYKLKFFFINSMYYNFIGISFSFLVVYCVL